MESTERRKLNRLLRKPNPAGINRSGSSKQRLVGRSSHGKQTRASSGAATTGANEPEETKPHGFFSVDVIKLCAEMCAVSNLSTPAASVLQKHVNQLARLLTNSILRVMEQNRRGTPQASDVDLAAVLVGLESPFGTTPATFLPIRTGGRTATSGSGGKVFFIRPDKEIDVKALLLREPAGVVYDVSLVAHWLAVNGKQPISPQTPPPDFLASMNQLNGSLRSAKCFTNQNDDSRVGPSVKRPALGIEGSTPLEDSLSRMNQTSLIGITRKEAAHMTHPRTISSMMAGRRPHEVSQEVMIYFRELTEACVGASENRRHEALDNATLDPGLQPILPHLVTFITEGVRVNVTNHNLAILIYLMRLVKALVDNAHICLEPYLHMLVPTVITCVLNRQLCAKPITDNHWALRDFAAKQLVTLCNRHNTSTNELYGRVTRELSRALNRWIDGPPTESTPPPPPDAAAASKSIKSTNESAAPNHDSSGSGQNNTESTNENNQQASSAPKGVTPNPIPSTIDPRGPVLGTALHSMNTLYGVLVALAEFGAQTLRILVFPLLPALCRRLTTIVEPPPPSTPSIVMEPSTGEQVISVVPSVAQLNRLSPADQRSFEFLKVMMTNRIATLLHDWRVRQSLGTSLDDYRASYACLATCLHGAATRQSQTANPIATASAAPSNPTPSSTQPTTPVTIVSRPAAGLIANSNVTVLATGAVSTVPGNFTIKAEQQPRNW